VFGQFFQQVEVLGGQVATQASDHHRVVDGVVNIVRCAGADCRCPDLKRDLHVLRHRSLARVDADQGGDAKIVNKDNVHAVEQSVSVILRAFRLSRILT